VSELVHVRPTVALVLRGIMLRASARAVRPPPCIEKRIAELLRGEKQPPRRESAGSESK